MGTVPVRVAPHRREARKQVRFSLSGAARRLRAPQAWKGQPSAGDTRTLPGRLMQTLTCASNINSKPRRDGSAERGRDFAKCRRCGATPLSGFAAAKARRARSRSSSSPVALAELCVAANAVSVGDMIGLNIFSTNVMALQRIESSVCPAPATSLREPIVAHAPEAVTRTQPELSSSARPFLRPVTPNWQVACGIYPQAQWVLPYYWGFSRGN